MPPDVLEANLECRLCTTCMETNQVGSAECLDSNAVSSISIAR